jgi:hypothetical protein
VLHGDTHYPDKVLSVFESHTEAIRKGKTTKPTEFGKLVKIQEAEAQFITDYAVCATRVPDQTLWEPRWSATCSSSDARRASRSRMVASPRAPMNRRRALTECATSSCRDNAEKAARAAIEPRSDGAPARKVASAP